MQHLSSRQLSRRTNEEPMVNPVKMLMVLAAIPMIASAQGGSPPPPPQGGSGQQAGGMGPDRAALEQQVKARLGEMMKKQLGLTDAQMVKLQETNRKFDEKRRLLVDQERDVRMSLRDEMLSPDSSRSSQVSGLLDRVVRVQRQRVDLLEQEQKELSGFLTPLQRAKYYGAEEQMRRRMQNMRLQQGQARMQGPRQPGARGGQMRGGFGRGGPGNGPPVSPPQPPVSLEAATPVR